MTLSPDAIEFKAVEVAQPIGSFYVGAIDSRDLVEISWADVQRIGDREFEESLGIQRELSGDRVVELQKYVNTVDATFPTGIILSVRGQHAEYDQDSSSFRIERAPNVAKIIDGQHRIAGLRAFAGDVFQCNVVIFVDMELEDQAMVFATINLKQTRVSKSLAYNLFEYATSRSPQKTCHDIAKLLNRSMGPFHDRIKILGKAIPGLAGQTLTQAAFVDRLLQLISPEPDRDRDVIKRYGSDRLERLPGGSRLIFRDLFIQGQDAAIAVVVENYFSSVARQWPNAWASSEQGQILGRTTGFAALMRLLPEVILALRKQPEDFLDSESFDSVFQTSPLQDSQFTTDNYQAGTSGESQLARDLRASLTLSE